MRRGSQAEGIHERGLAGEEWDPTCIVERHQRKKGWMFWDCFHGHTLGLGIFWEKD